MGLHRPNSISLVRLWHFGKTSSPKSSVTPAWEEIQAPLSSKTRNKVAVSIRPFLFKIIPFAKLPTKSLLHCHFLHQLKSYKMKLTASFVPVVALSALAHAKDYPDKTYSTKPAYPICKSHSSAFATVDDVHKRLFNYNGTGAKFFAGTNTWWASHLLSDEDLQTTFSQIKETQLQVVRVWGFGSVNKDPGPDTVFFQLLNSTGSYINYAANGIPRLDAVVSYAEKNGLKLVLPFVNNWYALN